jgi:plastocyanin
MGRVRSVIVVVAALLLAAPFVAVSSGATRAQTSAASVVASGLMNPRGFVWGSDGTLFVAEAGKGGTTPGDPKTPPPLGPVTGGKTARVSWIADGCPANLADHLPSYVTATDEVGGAADVAILNQKLYVLITGGGASHGNPDAPAGVYAVGGNEKVTLIANLGKWLRDHPVAKVPAADYDPEGSFFDMTATPDGNALLVVEANSQQLLSVKPDGTVSRVADLSGDNQVPTSVAIAPNGTIYVGYLSGAPYPTGAAKVVQIGDGTAKTVWTGLTTVTGLAVAPDGTLLALEMSTGDTTTPPFLVEHSGKIVRQTGPNFSADVVTDLNLPTHLNLGPDGAYYVATPAIGADAGTGSIVRIAPSGTEPVSAADAVPAPGACGVATPQASPTAANGGNSATNHVAVKIYDFGFDPPTLTIKVGTTVTWTNTGAVEHTSVSFDKGKKTWDSDILEPGASYSYTFDRPGTFDYECGLHPNMKAVIKVTK